MLASTPGHHYVRGPCQTATSVYVLKCNVVDGPNHIVCGHLNPYRYHESIVMDGDDIRSCRPADNGSPCYAIPLAAFEVD